VETWRGAVLVGADTQWRVLLTQVRQLDNGSRACTYSVRPGRSVTIVTWPGPDTLDPHDDIYARWARTLGAALPVSSY